MSVRVQGTAIIADLPARAVAVISSQLGQLIKTDASLAAGHGELADRQEAARRIMNLVTQQGYLQKAWNEPAGQVITVRLMDRLWSDVLHILERVGPEGPDVSATIRALQEGILERNGLLDEDGTISLPDSP